METKILKCKIPIQNMGSVVHFQIFVGLVYRHRDISVTVLDRLTTHTHATIYIWYCFSMKGFRSHTHTCTACTSRKGSPATAWKSSVNANVHTLCHRTLYKAGVWTHITCLSAAVSRIHWCCLYVHVHMHLYTHHCSSM